MSNRFFKLDVGLAYINAVSEEYGYSFALGLDFDPKSFKRETLNPLFWRALLAEFVGTAILLYVTLTSAVYGGPVIDTSEITTDSEASDTVSRIASLITNSNERFITSWVFGLTIFLLIYTYSPISGGHFNPAITWGLAVTKKVTVARAVLVRIARFPNPDALFSQTILTRFVHKNSTPSRNSAGRWLEFFWRRNWIRVSSTSEAEEPTA